MKAVAIVGVIGIHSLPDFWVPDFSLIEQFSERALRFAVPVFLAVSGFLYYRSAPIGLGTIFRRLRRILSPYLCVSVLAYVYSLWHPGHSSRDSLLAGLLLGAAFGPYYYVFLLVEFVLATWLLSRLPRTAVCVVFVLAVGTMVSTELYWWPPLGLFWSMRSPTSWGAWFLLGWATAMHRDAVLAFTCRYRPHILTTWLLIVAGWSVLFWSGALSGVADRTATVVIVAATVIALFVFQRGAEHLPEPITVLSNWTYALFLVHPFFIYLTRDIVEPRFGFGPRLWVPINWVSALVGALAITGLVRAVAGARSRDIIGA
jgi:peptidoglycan/LPS O-acetylase OafA/YrhL